MFIVIPSTEYSATVEGEVHKQVTCERCAHDYSYPMSRIAGGIQRGMFSSSSGPAKALINARENLSKVLKTEHDDMPCPECDWHQSHHMAFIRKQSYSQLKNLAGAFFIFAGLALGLSVPLCISIGALGKLLQAVEVFLVCSILVLAIASPGILLAGLRYFLLLKYNPNAADPASEPQ